jgi:hypothetical protein
MSAHQRHNTTAAMGLALAALTLATAVGLLTHPSPAVASVDQTTVLDPTPQLLNGAGPARRGDILDRLQALGVDSMRVQVQWRLLAPAADRSDRPEGFDGSDPGDYPAQAFEVLDSVVRGAKARGMQPLLTPTGPIPDWASSSGRGSLYDPDPDEFEDFVRALGERYDGTCVPPRCATGAAGEALPAVEQWAIWNEPNLKTFLRPQRDGDGRTVSGRIYRSLFLAAQRALASSGHARDLLLIGETAPSRGSNSTAPLRFLRQVFCLDRSYEPLRDCEPIAADGWSHHPYNPHIPPWQPPRPDHPSIVSIGSIDKLVTALRRSFDTGATVRRLPVFVTEYGVESHPQGGFGVSPQRQAEYLGIAEYLLYRNPWVDAFAQYLLDDDSNPRRLLSFQTGLRFANGFPKPSYDAFGITLVARQLKRGGVRLWGHVRPGAGPYQVRIRFRDGDSGPGQQVATLETDQGGYFRLATTYLKGREWQATADLPGSVVLQGPFIRSYRFP